MRREGGVEADAGAVFSTPRQLGPISRMPEARQTPSSSPCRAPPSAPVSPNPAEITSSARTPASAHCRATSATRGAGTTTTAKSTGSGISPTVR